MIYRFLFCLLFLSPMLPIASLAQDQSDGTLHVLRPSIDAEQDTAELCLEFDHPLDLSDHKRIIAGIRLEADGKTVPLSSSNISLTATLLCLQSLAYRQEYNLTVTGLSGANKEKLTGPYKLFFTVPDRQPTLVFSGDPGAKGLVRYVSGEDPIVHAINVARIHATLYRFTDPAKMAEAYRQRMQTTLAPSESLYYAQHNGQLVWQGELVIDDGGDKYANHSIERAIPLRAAIGQLPPGFYFVVVEDVAPLPKTKSADRGLNPMAGQWFIRSDLKIDGLEKEDGFFAMAEKSDASSVSKDIHFLVLDRDQQMLTEGQSDETGTAFLPVAGDKKSVAALLIGLAKSGDVDFVDVSPDGGMENHQAQFTLPNLEAGFYADRPFYQPADTVNLMLTARNNYGSAVATTGSSIQLLRSDHSFYASLPVPDNKNGVSWLSFPAPASNGLWNGQWQQADGHVLAQNTLKVTSNPKALQLEMTADRASLESDGGLTLTVKSAAADGTPVPYAAGHILVQWQTPESLAEASGYYFGNGKKTDTSSMPVAAFLTDAKGTAVLHMALKLPEDTVLPHTAVIRALPDPASGAFEPNSLSLTVKPGSYIAGIKPLSPNGKFPENATARFDVIALDGNYKRKAADDLEYQIYQEGRSFAWSQTGGHWDYQALQQRRRIGGGPLTIKEDGENLIHWPVTAGAYTIEITNTYGALLVSYRFDAGWGLLKPGDIASSNILLSSASLTAEVGAPVKINFTLGRPAMITAVIADDKIRKIIHRFFNTGPGTIEFTPEESWSNHIQISIKGEISGSANVEPLAGHIDLPVHHNAKELTITVEAPEHIAPGQEIMLPVTVGRISGRLPTSLHALVLPASSGEGANTTLSQTVKNLEVDGNGKAFVRLTAPVAANNLSLKIIAVNASQWGHKELSIPLRTDIDASLSAPSFMREGDNLQLPLDLKNNSAFTGAYRYVLTATGVTKITSAAEGKIKFSAPGTHQVISIGLTSVSAGAGEIRLELTGPQGMHLTHVWPVTVVNENSVLSGIANFQIAAQQSWTPSFQKPAADTNAKTENSPNIVFLGPQPLFNSPAILQNFLTASPFTVSEIAEWLETVRLWQDMIVGGGLYPAEFLKLRQKNILERLLTAQKADGSFSALPGGEGDIENTSAALAALARADQSFTKPAVDAAVKWLSQRFSNTWFDEQERGARAAGFAGLAAAERLDVSSLRYFAETSAGKSLPPLAVAQLATALAASGDQDKARAWLQTIHDKGLASLWPVLAANPLFNPQEIEPSLQKFAEDFEQHPTHDPQKLSAFLRGVMIAAQRSGNWRAAINGNEKDHNGIIAFVLPEKSAALVVHNPTDRQLYAAQAKREEPKLAAPANGITRHIYGLDGGEIAPNQLKQGNTYIVMLEAPWPAKIQPGESLLVNDAPGRGLHPLSCAIDGTIAQSENWRWVEGLSLTKDAACEGSAHGINAAFTYSAGAKGTWRMAYLVQAKYAGVFHSRSGSARQLGADDWITGGSATIEIR